MIAGIALGLLIGLALGALGGGGSILAVPVLAHLAGQSAPAATATALVAVGVSAAVGSVGHARKGNVRWGAAAAFVATGVAGSWIGTRLNGRLDGDVLLLAFSGLVLVAAHRMLFACPTCTNAGEEKALAAAERAEHGEGGGAPPASIDLDDATAAAALDEPAAGIAGSHPAVAPTRVPGAAQLTTERVDAEVLAADDGVIGHEGGSGLPDWASPAGAANRSSGGAAAITRVLLAGSVVGLLTGLFGVGGGFVIVPALALALGLNMPKAIGTSLVIIVGNAIVALGFRGVGSVDWGLAVGFTGTMIVGSVAGSVVAHRLPVDKTLRAFAGLLVAVAIANGVAAGWAIWG